MTFSHLYTHYKKWFLLGLLVQVVAAWFSIGYHHPDEHFQVLEFCNYKLGFSPVTDLPWEYAAQCRPALQPLMAYGLSKLLLAAGLYNPFTVAFVLRLLVGIFTWVVSCRIVLLMLPEFTTDIGKKVWVYCCMLLWFVPYVGVRFSAENIGGLLFFFSLSYLLPMTDFTARKNVIALLVTGLLLGLAFFLRLQLAAGYAAFGLWILIYRKWPLSYWLYAATGFVVAIALSVCMDHWLYGEWVFTPYKYFDLNIVQHVAAKYGVYPWYYYFDAFFNLGVPPISIVMMLLFFAGVAIKKQHVFTWIAVAIILEHCFVAHKEMRFLFPVSLAFIFLACSGFEWLWLRYPDKTKMWLVSLKVLMVVNTAVILAKISTPAHETITYQKAIYDYCRHHDVILVCEHESVYHKFELEIDFYKPRNMVVKVVENEAEIQPILQAAGSKEVIFLSTLLHADPILSNYKTEKLYCTVPDWAIEHLNFNDWQSRSYIWNIYKIRATP
jgi:phosphatidylinositol glycan class B